MLLEAQYAKDICAKLLRNGATIDQLIILLKAIECSQAETTFVLSKAANLEFSEAKKLVIESPVWEELLDANRALEKGFNELLGGLSE